MPKKTTGKAPFAKDAAKRKAKSPLFEARKKNFGIGNNIQPKRDVTRFVRWPRYVQLQRKKRILMQRLKVPPTINQFTKTVDKATASTLFKLLDKYRPETRKAKTERLHASAKDVAAQKEQKAPQKPNVIHYGLNHVTSLVERKEAKLVVIAHDVDPIELVVWLPTLCRKMDVPYVIVKGKARLGTLVHKKCAAAIALTSVNKEDAKEFTTLSTLAMDSYNKNPDIRRMWGGQKLGPKAVAAQRIRERILAKERMVKQLA